MSNIQVHCIALSGYVCGIWLVASKIKYSIPSPFDVFMALQLKDAKKIMFVLNSEITKKCFKLHSAKQNLYGQGRTATPNCK